MFLCTLKFGGYWKLVKNEERKKYEGEKQKTVRIDEESLDFAMLKMEVERVCSWLKGHTYELHYHISGTSPKQYKNINTNNLAESFNAWVTEARDKPIVELVDIIRGKIMEHRAKRKMNSASWTGVMVPAAEEYIREITTRKDTFIVRQSTAEMAEVEGKNVRHEESACLRRNR